MGNLFQVFDGHDGESAACYVKEHLLPFILRDASFSSSVEDAVKNAYLELDKEFLEACRLNKSLSSGTTVLTALLQGRLVHTYLVVRFVCTYTASDTISSVS